MIRNINRLFVQLSKVGENDPTRNYFDQDLDALIDNKSFFKDFIKNKQKAFEKHVKRSRNNDFKAGIALDYLYYKLHFIS